MYSFETRRADLRSRPSYRKQFGIFEIKKGKKFEGIKNRYKETVRQRRIEDGRNEGKGGG